MRRINLAEAKARLSELVDEAASGHAVCIMRRGKPVARIVAAEEPRKPVDVAALRELTDSMPRQAESAADFVRRMRDDERY
ncbi:MAG TPA: type II toxin-antitoxin system prevent-host-death family antitoxin [Stellaceae bacterium]|nr:type II toxin-antitoxin system prevent-host-death family antitoxin [Stellaceae bacterium]